MVMGGGRDPRTHPGSRCRGAVEELPLVVHPRGLIRRRDLSVIALSGGGPGHRNDPIHYRGSAVEALCRSHARVLADGGYRGILELVAPTFQGNRVVRDRRWKRHRKRRARVEHALARLKDWRVLRDHRRQDRFFMRTLAAVAFLHNLRIATPDALRDSS